MAAYVPAGAGRLLREDGLAAIDRGFAIVVVLFPVAFERGYYEAADGDSADAAAVVFGEGDAGAPDSPIAEIEESSKDDEAEQAEKNLLSKPMPIGLFRGHLKTG